MTINFPSNPANNEIYVAPNGTNWAFSNVKNVWSVVSTVGINVNKHTANNWVNPDTGNTFSCIQVTGAKKIETPPIVNIQHNTISMGVQTLGYNVSTDTYNNVLTIPRSLDANIDAFFCNAANSNIIGAWNYANVHINGVLYPNYLSFNETANAEYYIFQTYTEGDPAPEIIIEENAKINISIDFRPSTPWFDPAELGITNFRSAQLQLRAYVDGPNGYNKIVTFDYIRPKFTGTEINNQNIYSIITTRNGTPGDGSDHDTPLQDLNFLEWPYNDNKLYCTHYGHPNWTFCGNLYVQYTGTIWTGIDGLY